MNGKQSEFDYLNYSKNSTINNNVTCGETIIFSDKIYKINKMGWKQQRNIVLTDKAIYNLKKTTLKRRIDLYIISGVTVSKITDEFVIHCGEDDYDYHYISQKRRTIIELLSKTIQELKSEELRLFEVDAKSLSTYVTRKKEKEKNQSITKMPSSGQVSLNYFLAGKGKKGGKKGFQNVPVTLSDFKMIQTIGRGSVGKIYLVEYNKDGIRYAMKSMRKDQLISEGIADNILVEKNVLMDGQSPFLLSLSFYFQTKNRIYFVTPFIPGGDLFHRLRKEAFLKEEEVKFYAAQVVIALQYLHDMGICYRDLKPENILIEENGYIKLCDFGASCKMTGAKKETSFGGSPEYVAPEMITQEGHTFMSDWWSLGILIYELLYGFTPFFNMDKHRMFDLIKTSAISFPKIIKLEGETKERTYKISEDAKNIITKLLEKDPGARFGKKGMSEIKKHPFFSGVSFSDITARKAKVPYKPDIDMDDLSGNFEEEYLNMELSESPTSDWSKDSQYSNWFNNFDTDGDGGEEGGNDGDDDDDDY
jgi:serine/threonine protein kinase